MNSAGTVRFAVAAAQGVWRHRRAALFSFGRHNTAKAVVARQEGRETVLKKERRCRARRIIRKRNIVAYMMVSREMMASP